MRYFPQRARKRTVLDRNLKVCTHCLGDMFADGRCVQCHARINATPLYERLQMVRQSISWPGHFSR